MGYYQIAVISAFVILWLSFKIIHINTLKKIEIKYKHKLRDQGIYPNYLKNTIFRFRIWNLSDQNERDTIYTNVYRIKEIPREMQYSEIVEDISMNKNIMTIRMVSI